MAEKMDIIPYKIYRAKVQAETTVVAKDANTANSIPFKTTTTTNENAQTGLTNEDFVVTTTAKNFTTSLGVQSKTQIAKLTYKSPTAATATAASTSFNTMVQKLPTKQEQNESETQRGFEGLNSQKNIRVQETQEKQNDLTTFSQTNNKPAEAVENVLENIPIVHISVNPSKFVQKKELKTALGRSKSDMAYKSQETVATQHESACATNRSLLNRNLSQSTTALQTVESKQKHYNPADARRFIEEQRKKRRSRGIGATDAQKTAIEKEAIKKRLEDLKKSTRKILDKNLQKKTSVPKHTECKTVESVAKEDKVMMGVMSFKRPTPRGKKQALNIVEEKSEEYSSKEEFLPLLEHKKRVGLLRKPDYKDHSYSAIKDLNKENIGENLIVPTSPTPADTLMSAKLQVPALSLKSSVHLESDPTSARQREPSAERLMQREKNIKDDKVEQLKADMPYWLRPSSVQIYPYNFIKAVRRKLEAITNPQVQDEAKLHAATSTTGVQEPTKGYQTTSLGDLQQKTHSIQPLSLKPVSAKRSISCSSLEQGQQLQQGHSFATPTELTSNFSSISIQLPASNTISEVSSLASDVQNASSPYKSQHKIQKERILEADDTTMSSAILNSMVQNERVVSPLNLGKVEQLHIQTKSERIEKENSARSQRTNLTRSGERPLDFDKFLHDFNRSLTQMIQVNAQLKSTLDKSHSIHRTSNDEKSSSKQQQYTSDFEETSHELSSATRTLSTTSKHTNSEERAKKINLLKQKLLEKKKAQTASLSVLSPTSINNSCEQILCKSKSLSPPSHGVTQTKSNTSQSIKEELTRTEHESLQHLNGSAAGREHICNSRESLIHANVNSARGDFVNTPNDHIEEYLVGNNENFQTSGTLLSAQSEKKLEKLEKVISPAIPHTCSTQSELELSFNLSESSLNYSHVGLYEKLIQKEASREEYLTAWLKTREKCILDRTKSQIALLEVQKERFKSRGLLAEIAVIKKKQRGILLKMEREREEIKR